MEPSIKEEIKRELINGLKTELGEDIQRVITAHTYQISDHKRKMESQDTLRKVEQQQLLEKFEQIQRMW